MKWKNMESLEKFNIGATNTALSNLKYASDTLGCL
jgi:hypothetical protein